MTNDDHNRYVAWAFAGYAGFQALISCLIIAMFYVFTIGSFPGEEPPTGVFIAMAAFVGVIHSLFIFPSIIASYAIFKRKPWARIAGIIAAATAVMNMPVGTGAAAYAFWFFFSDNWKSVYPPDDEMATQAGHRQLEFRDQPEWDAGSRAGSGFHDYQSPPDWR